jgi:cell division ATPase FtsA
VVNIESTVESIQRALEEAELMADCKITRVYTGIAGSHIRSFNSSGMVAIKDKEVTAADVARNRNSESQYSDGSATAAYIAAGIYCRQPG